MQDLRRDNDALLDELAEAYTQLEILLTNGTEETEIAYQELRKRNQDLQSRLVELQQAHDRLRETQALLVRSERLSAMGQMAAAIVHEINNPLTAISGRVELLLMRDEVPYREDLEKVKDATHTLAELARNVLRFARKEGADEGALSWLPVNPAVENVLDFFQPLIKGIELESRLQQDLPSVRGVAAQVEQVLTNLVVNAVDALKGSSNGHLLVATGMGSIGQVLEAERAQGRPTALARSVSEEDMARMCVYAAIEDNGPGMKVEVMEQIFEAFFTTKGEDSGTGLGLSICRTITESMGANLLVASRPDDGTSFRLFLRARQEGES